MKRIGTNLVVAAALFFSYQVAASDVDMVKAMAAQGKRVVMPGADLQGGVFSGLNLKRADLSGANLSHSSLNNTDLSGADLSGADLTDVYMVGTILKGTNLKDVVGLRANQRKNARRQGALNVSVVLSAPVVEEVD